MPCLQGQLRPFTCVRPALTDRSTVLSPSVLLTKPVLHLNRCKLWPRTSYGPLTCKFALLDQAWGTHVNAQELATNIFSTSIFPYSAFLYFLTKSKKTPPLALFGFYFLLFFVFATIPAGVIALKVYKKSLANVDFLHGSAESMLTVTNLLIVLGFRQGIREAEMAKDSSKSDPHGADAAQSMESK